ncbi:hypothetical protein [Vibrio bivalvicida]|uniref:Lipocalin-like domain-containing protein n=1 Tax=Vibrio bivalvicida TaxID=1276888 RepID=A0ABV4MMA3_9VIBR
MNRLILIAFSVALVACSATDETKVSPKIKVDRALFSGTWHCATPENSEDDEISYDGKTTYANNGLLDGRALFSIEIPDVSGEFVYEVKINGTWELKHNEVHEYIDSVSVKSLNDISVPFEEMLRKAMEKTKVSVSTILAINSKQLTWRSESGAVDSCTKVLE